LFVETHRIALGIWCNENHWQESPPAAKKSSLLEEFGSIVLMIEHNGQKEESCRAKSRASYDKLANSACDKLKKQRW
jgi:hypothetical protein